jgi:hypothetical protein
MCCVRKRPLQRGRFFAAGLHGILTNRRHSTYEADNGGDEFLA